MTRIVTGCLAFVAAILVCLVIANVLALADVPWWIVLVIGVVLGMVFGRKGK